MKRLTIIIAVLIVVVFTFNNFGQKSEPMNITSTAFEANGLIPSKYTCDGENISPQLSFVNTPKDAQSLVLIMDDPDIPEFVKEQRGIEVFDHWVVFNIPANTTEIGEGQKAPGIVGLNSRGTNEYVGSCPPDKEHRYFFKLYALDTMLDLVASSTKAQVEDAMSGHVLEKAELIGRYERK